jgi:hypothetical protein
VKLKYIADDPDEQKQNCYPCNPWRALGEFKFTYWANFGIGIYFHCT